MTHVLNATLSDTTWRDPGCDATDAVDGNLTSSVIKSVGAAGPPDMTKPTSPDAPYEITFSVSNGGGLAAATAIRRLVVLQPCPGSLTLCVDGSCAEFCSAIGLGATAAAQLNSPSSSPLNTPPTIELIGPVVVELSVGAAFQTCPPGAPLDAICDRGAFASDAEDGLLTPQARKRAIFHARDTS